MNDDALILMHSALSQQVRIWHGADAVDRRAAIFPKLLIAAFCWTAMFFQQIEACSPDAFRRTPVVSQIKFDYLAAPDLRDFSGNLVHAASRVTSTFDFDSGGNRARQTKERIAANDSRKIEFTLYLGSYEREIHQTKANGAAPAVLAKTVHRHSLGGGVVYTRTSGGTEPGVKLMAVLADHLGSTDVIVTGKWNTSTAAFANITTERQSFDAWGERRAADTQVNYRATDGDAFRTSAQEHHRGYTGHEQLDDSGLIHMNGRIYDPELGRFLSPDPYVQIPEYSQNFNRYSYVLNNPLNATDPSGFSFLSKFFSKVGSWIKENWRTVVSIVVGVALAFVLTPFGGYGFNLLGNTFGITGGFAQGAIVGSAAGGSNSAINGGDLGDVLRGAAVGGLQGGISGSLLHGWESTGWNLETLRHVAGHGIVGGAANAAMGGKFQDGFISAAVSAGAGDLGFTSGSNPFVRTIKAGIVGGTASVLGGGKFANGAYTAAFQHLLNAEVGDLLHPLAEYYDPLEDGEWLTALKVSEGFAKALSIHSEYLNEIAEKYNLNPRLIAAILINENRGWGATGTTMTIDMLASAMKKGDAGSYGPAQLGPSARKYAGLSIEQALTARGAILGSASWLDYQRKSLISEGVKSPNAAQISSRYNAGLSTFAPGTVTKYGLQIRALSGIK